MGWRTVDKLIRWLIVVLAVAMVYDGYHLLRAGQLNRVLLKVEAGGGADVANVVNDDNPHLRFAGAYVMQQDGDFDAALEAYAGIDVADGHPLQSHTRYNLANLYLRRALEHRADGADDLALPLVELAKEYFRELLREDSQDWSAKYNLELALKLAPETDLEPPEEERNPEHNPRSAAGIQVRKPLP